MKRFQQAAWNTALAYPLFALYVWFQVNTKSCRNIIDVLHGPRTWDLMYKQS